MIDEFELAEAVDAGAEFMDAIDPDWFWIVNPETLNMANTSTCDGGGCVIAQHHPRGYLAPTDYGIGWELGTNLSDLGFNVTRGGTFTALTALWREAIQDRRSAYFDRHPGAVLA